MLKKLYIYDATSLHDRFQAAGRFEPGDDDIQTLPAKAVSDVIVALKGFLSKGMVFDRMLFQTHGFSGRIWFDNDSIFPFTWDDSFAGNGFAKLFPTYSRIHFDGCDVADGDIGVRFLRA